ncbi:hypothetical protein I600_1960 [Maribacter dokdonensis DSW-8]|nr:hypothetical protein I600_1960 [Maribacter dokdonensis DSW-8]
MPFYGYSFLPKTKIEPEGFNGYDQYLWHKKADFNNRLFQTNSN